MKPSFQQTEVGVIPEDWEVQQMGNISAITTGRKDVNEGNPNGEYPFFTCSRAHTFSNSYSFNTEAILIAGNGDVGNLHYYRGPFEAYQRTYVIHNFSAHVRYFWHQLNYRLIESLGLGKIGTSIPYIKKENLTGFSFPLPPTLAEQEAIASALGDADALIESQEWLVAKKRDVKQGAMQELLTARRRLPGFTGKWETKRLGEIGDIRSGGTPSTRQSHFWDGDVPWCTPTDVTALLGHKYLTRTARTISAAGLQSSSAEIIPPRSLIMTSRATIGACSINLIPMSTNQGFKNIVPIPEFDVEFLYYLMTTQTSGLIALCGGSTFLEIGKHQLSSYDVSLPEDRAEQTAIAAVLSDMDAEIAALEAKLAKARAIKQGMMQELLTGRIRLK